MHVEIQIALNFLISFLYNKLPRRRVNQFGEELENIVKTKFDGHWYPDEPYKGSAYRCIHCNPQLDSSLFREAARNSGLNLKDVQENLPNELSIWIDPGEVSYRMSEKGPVNILYSSKAESAINNKPNAETSMNGSLNPEAQCFQPTNLTTTNAKTIVDHSSPTSNLLLLDNVATTNGKTQILSKHHQNHETSLNNQLTINAVSTPTMATTAAVAALPTTFIQNKHDPTVTLMTTAAFAATKFGSTKPKVQMKKQYHQRTSPTETQQQTMNKPFFLNNRKPIITTQNNGHHQNGIKTTKFNINNMNNNNNNSFNNAKTDLLLNYTNLNNNFNNALTTKTGWTTTGNQLNNSNTANTMANMNHHHQNNHHQQQIQLENQINPKMAQQQNDLFLVNNLMDTSSAAVVAAILNNSEQQQQQQQYNTAQATFNNSKRNGIHYPSPSLSPSPFDHLMMKDQQKGAIYLPELIANDNHNHHNHHQQTIGMSLMDNNNTPLSSATTPTPNLMADNIPCFMPDQLLREIFDLSATSNNENINGNNHQLIMNGSFTNNGTQNGTFDTNDLFLMTNGSSSQSAHGGPSLNASNATATGCNFTLSPSPWSFNELMDSSLNMINNEFDNLSINSTSSSSLGSVSSYAT